MARALSLARRGLGETNPNPVVGCVVVESHAVIGEGYHSRAGGPHAEVLALAQAGSRARGATLYVTLEPCAHQGRTPPCATAVAASGVRRVVAAMIDPDHRVAGRGLAMLRRAGVAVTAGVCEAEAAALNARFVAAAGRDTPFVLLKVALTLDGRIATATGESQWITSARQRRVARALRRLHDGVMVGIGTVLADDPRLLPSPRVRRPFYRVVLDSRLRLPLKSRLVKSAARSPVWVVAPRGASAARRRRLEAQGVTVVEAGRASRRPPVVEALRALRARGLSSLMVEGGSEVLGSFLAAGAFDQVALFRAPLLLGGRGSLPAFGGPNPRALSAAHRLERVPGGDPALDLAGGGAGDPAFELWRPS